MSTYATIQDLIDRFGELEIAQRTNRENLDVIDTLVAGRALEDANAEVHGYVATRLRVPPDPVPVLLVRVTCDAARYRLYEDAVSKEVLRRYEDAKKLLTAIARGEISIGPPEASPTHPQTVVTVQGKPGLFARRSNGGLR